MSREHTYLRWGYPAAWVRVTLAVSLLLLANSPRAIHAQLPPALRPTASSVRLFGTQPDAHASEVARLRRIRPTGPREATLKRDILTWTVVGATAGFLWGWVLDAGQGAPGTGAGFVNFESDYYYRIVLGLGGAAVGAAAGGIRHAFR
jgi:hypothetical protein